MAAIRWAAIACALAFGVYASACRDGAEPPREVDAASEPAPAARPDKRARTPAPGARAPAPEEAAERCALDKVGGYQVTLSVPDADKAAPALRARAKVLNPDCAPYLKAEGPGRVIVGIKDQRRVTLAAVEALAVPGRLWVAPWDAPRPEDGSEVDPPASAITLAVRHAAPSDGQAQSVVVDLSEASGQAFAALTREHTGGYLALGLDREILMVPRIMEPITGGTLHITLGASDGGARDQRARVAALAATLRQPPLEGPVELEELRDIGPAQSRD